MTTIVMCLHNTRIWEFSIDERLKCFTFYLYSVTALIRSLITVITNYLITSYRGRLKFHDLRAVMPYVAKR